MDEGACPTERALKYLAVEARGPYDVQGKRLPNEM